MSNTKIYGKLGLGSTKFSMQNDMMKLSKNTMIGRLGIGLEHMMGSNVSMFAEFTYDMPFKEAEYKPKKITFENSTYAIKLGARYFF